MPSSYRVLRRDPPIEPACRLNRTYWALLRPRSAPLCLSKISKYLSGWRLYTLHNSIILAYAHFSHDIPRSSVLDLPFPCCPSAREPGSAPPNRRASEVRSKTAEFASSGRPVVDLPVPPLARLALGAGHRQARNGHCLASCRLSALLDVEGAARPTRTTAHFAPGPRSDPQDVPGESQLGCTPHPRRAAQTRHRNRGEQRQQIHGALPQAAVADLAHLSGESCPADGDRKSTRLNSSHRCISYAVFC